MECSIPDTPHPTFRTIASNASTLSAKSPWQAVRRLVESVRLRDLPDDATTTPCPFRRNCMKRILSFLAVLVALAVAAPAAAPGSDRQHSRASRWTSRAPSMPGVTVTISSPVLVAGSMTGVTDAGGVYRFPSLVPGTYTRQDGARRGSRRSTARTSSCSSARRRRSTSR